MAIKHKLHKTKKTILNELAELTGHQRVTLFVIAFAIVGSIIIVATHAAGPTVSIEPDSSSSTITSPATKTTGDSTASANAYVQFNKASTATQTTNCSPSPHLCGFPDTTNTGIQSGITLTQVPGQATSGTGWTYSGGGVQVTGSNITVQNLELADGVTMVVRGTNVVLNNVKLDGAHGQDTDAILVCGSFNSGGTCNGTVSNGVSIKNCELTGSTSANSVTVDSLRGWNGIHIMDGATNITVDRCNIHGFAGGFYIAGEHGSGVYTNNYVHHIVSIDNVNTDHCNDWSLDPGSIDSSGQSVLVQNNTFMMDHPNCGSTAIQFAADYIALTNLNAVVDHNLFSGATTCFDPGNGHVDGSGGINGPSFMGFTNNHLSTANGKSCGSNAYTYPPTPLDAHFSSNYQCGNVWDDGNHAGSGADDIDGNRNQVNNGNGAGWYFFYPTSGSAQITPLACVSGTLHDQVKWTIPGAKLSW